MTARFDALLAWLARYGKHRPKGRARVAYVGRHRDEDRTQVLPAVVDASEPAYAEAGAGPS